MIQGCFPLQYSLTRKLTLNFPSKARILLFEVPLLELDGSFKAWPRPQIFHEKKTPKISRHFTPVICLITYYPIRTYSKMCLIGWTQNLFQIYCCQSAKVTLKKVGKLKLPNHKFSQSKSLISQVDSSLFYFIFGDECKLNLQLFLLS